MIKKLQQILPCMLLMSITFSTTHMYTRPTLFIDTDFSFYEKIITPPHIVVRSSILSNEYIPKQSPFGISAHETNIHMIFKASEFIQQFQDTLPSSAQTILSYLDWIEIKLNIRVSDEYLVQQDISDKNPVLLSLLLADALSSLEHASMAQLLHAVALTLCPFNIDPDHFKKITISLYISLTSDDE